MNIHSNASRSYVESVAFMAAYSSLLTPERQIKFLDQVFDLFLSPSLSSFQRMAEFRALLMKYQEFVMFMPELEAGLLEPSPSKHLKAKKSSSSSQLKELGYKLKKLEYARNLEYYVLDVLKQTPDS